MEASTTDLGGEPEKTYEPSRGEDVGGGEGEESNIGIPAGGEEDYEVDAGAEPGEGGTDDYADED